MKIDHDNLKVDICCEDMWDSLLKTTLFTLRAPYLEFNHENNDKFVLFCPYCGKKVRTFDDGREISRSRG